MSSRSVLLRRTSRYLAIATAMLLGATLFVRVLRSEPVTASTWYVDSAGTGNGTSWTSAWPTIESALSSTSVNTGDSIWVKQGTYTPTNLTTGFYITKQLYIYGSFAGNANETPQTRVGGPSILDGAGSAKHVVTVSGVTGPPEVLIDGFEIKGGNATGPNASDKLGGGIYASGSDLYLVGCTIDNNSAYSQGGGIWFQGLDYQHTTLKLKRCELVGNTASHTSGSGYDGSGGGLWGEFMLGFAVNTTFSKNHAGRFGGGTYFQNVSSTFPFEFDNCQLWGNFASDPTLSHGGAICAETSACVLSMGCSIADNYTTNCVAGQALYCGSGSSAIIYNSIIFFNYQSCSNGLQLAGSPITCGASDVEVSTGSYSGNMNSDPKFSSHATGRLRLLSTSPCIDAGDGGHIPPDSLDLDGNLNFTEQVPFDLLDNFRAVDVPPQGGTGSTPFPDMGAFEAH